MESYRTGIRKESPPTTIDWAPPLQKIEKSFWHQYNIPIRPTQDEGRGRRAADLHPIKRRRDL